MGIRLFILAAIVLVVFGIIAAAGTSGQLFSVDAIIWFMASFLAFLTDLALGGVAYVNGGFQRGPAQPAQPVV
jgi:hypothetical protein